jgi:hypothetical protein
MIAALMLGGCKKKQEQAPVPAAGSAMAGSAVAAAEPPKPAAPAAVDIPTEQDFEAQAKSNIDDKNVDSKLKELEAQLGQ